jgi:predicted  nucleic acid-binding Zn-ribbon protein
MTELIDTVRDLLRLNQLDLGRHALQVELKQSPARIEELGVNLGSRDAARDRLAGEFRAARSSLAEAEVLLAKTEKRRSRAQERIPLLQTAEQVEATQREIVALAEAIDELESEILERMDLAEALEQSAAAAVKSAEEGSVDLAVAKEKWAERRPLLDAQMTQLDSERTPIAEGLRSDIRRRYQLAWRQRGKTSPSGLTQVVGRICETCHTEISARWLQESREHVALHSCQGCKRLLLFDPDAPETVAASNTGGAEQLSSR